MPRTPTRPRTLAAWFLLLAIVLAACTPETVPSLATGTPSTAARAVACATIVGGTARLQPQVEPPDPGDVPGAAEGEGFELNDEAAPPVRDDPKGAIPDLTALPPVTEAASGAQGGAQPDDLVLYRPVTTLDAGADTSPTSEPEVAMDGQHVFVTWNRLAAVSADGGATFKYLNPQTTFASANGGFCCDQRVLHLGRQHLWLWVLQYRADQAGNNTIRLAWATDEGFDANDFSYVDWTGPDLGFDAGTLLDQTKIATSDRFAYLSLNAFVQKTGTFIKGAVIRVPLDGLTAGGAVQSSCLTPTDPRTGDPFFGTIPTRGAGNTMYLAAHVSNTELAVFSWPDDAAAPTFHSIVDHDANGTPIKYPSIQPYSCLRTGAPTTSDWCYRPSDGKPGNDARPTSAWVANGHIGVAWNASQSGTARVYPFAWVVVLDESKLGACATGDCILGYPYIATNSTAVQYSAITENASGEMGAVALLGGGERYLTCAVLVHGPITQSDTSWQFTTAGVSNLDLKTPTSGDYLGVALDAPGSASWIGTCMSYQSIAGGIGSMQIHVSRFGRSRDDPLD